MSKVRQGQHEGVQLVHGAMVGMVVSGGEQDGATCAALGTLAAKQGLSGVFSGEALFCGWHCSCLRSSSVCASYPLPLSYSMRYPVSFNKCCFISYLTCHNRFYIV